MQPCGGGSCGAKLPGVNGLVALLVLELCLDIGRQRHLPHILQGGKEVPLAGELHHSISVFLDLHYLADEPAAAEGKPGANLGFLARTADQLPQLIPFLLQQ